MDERGETEGMEEPATPAPSILEPDPADPDEVVQDEQREVEEQGEQGEPEEEAEPVVDTEEMLDEEADKPSATEP